MNFAFVMTYILSQLKYQCQWEYMGHHTRNMTFVYDLQRAFVWHAVWKLQSGYAIRNAVLTYGQHNHDVAPFSDRIQWRTRDFCKKQKLRISGCWVAECIALMIITYLRQYVLLGRWHTSWNSLGGKGKKHDLTMFKEAVNATW